MRVVRNVYLPPFKAGVEEGAATLMSGFNDLNGIPTSGHKMLLTDILRDEWGFNGFVVSDFRSVKQIIYHGFGIVSEEIIDTAVRRILRIKFMLGLFENPYVDPKIQESVILAPEHRQLARQSVRESMVLLKNENDLLPLNKDIKSIALIGPLADNAKDHLGTWVLTGREADVITLKQGLENAVSKKSCTINYAKGCESTSNSADGFAEAVEAAKKSELVIMAVGESEEHNGEAHSRTNIGLPGAQLQLLQEIHKTGKPIVMVLFTGRPLTINWELENIPAILLAWHPGVEGGNGITDVLFGDSNPAGKLTVTFPRNVGQIPIYYNLKNTGRPILEDERFTTKYIDCPNTPLLPFGHGLSYTTFAYSNLKIENPKVKIPGTIQISADVTNTGSVPGHEVVQSIHGTSSVPSRVRSKSSKDLREFI
jgi:beta-glucosidase